MSFTRHTKKVIGVMSIVVALTVAAMLISFVHAAGPSAPTSSIDNQLPAGWLPPIPARMPASQLLPSNSTGSLCNSPCTPPLIWRDGKVLRTPHVFLIYWGTLWNNTKAPNYAAYLAIETRMKTLFSHLAGSSYNAILSQYHDSTGFIINSIKDPVLQASVGLPKNPPANITPTAEAAAIQTALNANPTWKTIDDAIFFLIPQDGSTYNDLTLDKGCAYHYITNDATNRAYAMLPYLANTKFHNCLAYGDGNLTNAMTVTATHEYAEAVTDPYVNHLSTLAWRDKDNANEISDLCAPEHSWVSALGAEVSLQFDNKAWDANHAQGCDTALYAPPPVPKVVFGGYDPQGNDQLWITDGSLSGTFFLKNIAGASTTGVSPGDMVSIGTKAVFSGYDAKKNFQVWATNGTSSGTLELTTITNTVGAGRGGVDPFNFTPFNGKALFTGYDAKGNNGLWITDGTSGGTHELTTGNISPVSLTVWGTRAYFYAAGYNPVLWITDGTLAGTKSLPGSPIQLDDFTIFGKDALFAADDDPFGDVGVWFTDGTDAGTHRVQDPTKPGFALGPANITVIGGKAVFDAFDSHSRDELWVTDGTATGTVELTTITYDNGIGSLSPGFITAYGSQALFNGIDAQGLRGMWITNGTASGTHEVTTLAGSPYYFTRFGSQILFNANDASLGRSLWITNGTATGTKRLGTFFNLDPHFITIMGNKAVFRGLESGWYAQLWVTDGTAAGTKELTPNAATNGGVYPNNLALI